MLSKFEDVIWAHCFSFFGSWIFQLINGGEQKSEIGSNGGYNGFIFCLDIETPIASMGLSTPIAGFMV